MVVTAKCGRVAMCEAIQPSVPDLGCGFQSHFSAGTRSRALRVLAPSWSHSVDQQFVDWHCLAPAEMSGDEVDCTGTEERQANLGAGPAEENDAAHTLPSLFCKKELQKVLKTKDRRL